MSRRYKGYRIRTKRNPPVDESFESQGTKTTETSSRRRTLISTFTLSGKKKRTLNKAVRSLKREIDRAEE